MRRGLRMDGYGRACQKEGKAAGISKGKKIAGIPSSP
jgi:hypothetical protein